ncbi:hypothetical protein [Devosia sp.]|uniref:hypothetical protein n=1 Tax=Devosia sp. TaxID=1871048 RepID=UPI001AD039E1|nr:hypothetical protein [Devosia sp.]MBN9333633.1 hypothetical protein [Devosia sp.]
MKIGKGKDSRHFRTSGQRSGYTEYRYGDECLRPVYDPSKPHGRQPVITDKAHKKRIIRDTAAILREWESSAFEHEAACRHGLRQGFCENGAGWTRADDEAAYIVREALHSNGAKRPTWDQGQWHHTAGRDNCAWCHREIDDPNATRGQRYCSTECATQAVQHRGGRDAVRFDNVVRQAYRQVQRAKAKPKPCEHCGTPFRSERKGARFCSLTCSRRATGYIKPEKNCPECNSAFKPQKADQAFCSYRCAAVAKVAARREALPPAICTACDQSFKPAVQGQHYCSKACRKKVDHLHQRVRKGTATLVPFAFDQYFTLPINSSRPVWLTPERFDEMAGG